MNVTKVVQASPVIRKRQARWGSDIRLEHFHFRAGELPEHRHTEHLIAISLSDRCSGEIRTPSGFRARNGDRGSICVIPAGQSMTTRLESESEHLALYLEPSLLWRAAGAAHAPRHFEIIEKCAPGDPVISSIGMALLNELETDGLGGLLYAESLANVLAVHLLRHYTITIGHTGRSFTGGLSGQRLRRVVVFLASNYTRDLSLTELAGVAEISTFHFAREFKRATGTTPHQHVIKLRVERAKALLADRELPLVEVGLKSGFSDQSHFTRLFHKLTGTTPRAYRLGL